MPSSAVDHAANPPVLREAAAIVRRYPLACFVPAVVLGLVIQLTHLLHLERAVAMAVLFVTGIVAFCVYLAYIEEVAAEAERGAERIGWRHALRLMRRSLAVIVAISIATAITLVSISVGIVLALVGLYALTRWSLAVPIIAERRVDGVTALRESAALTRGVFWAVALTAALAIVVEQVATSILPYYATPSRLGVGIGGWLVGAAITSLVMPFSGLVVSVTYRRRSEGLRPRLL